MLKITHLLVEYKSCPLGMDEPEPRFSFRAEGDGKTLTSRRITVTDPAGKTVWDSGEVHSPETCQIVYEGMPLAPRTRYLWQVTVRDDAGSTAQAESHFETGMMGTPWPAEWIAGRTVSANHLPVQRAEKTFVLEAVPENARLYISALGLYEAKINGSPVTDSCFNPGWTNYYGRVQYQVYDVTTLLHAGENTISADLADGWYTGRIARMWLNEQPTWGEYPMLTAAVFNAGKPVVKTDGSWKFRETDTRMSDIYDGETVNRRIGVLNPLGTHIAAPAVRLEWTSGAPVRVIRTLIPAGMTYRANGNWIIDFGVNFTGREKITIRHAVPGTVLYIRHGEMLREYGSLYTENLRSAVAATTYIAKGEPGEIYTPRFTFYGFRYLEITGWPGELSSGDVVGEVLASDLAETGTFHCSNELVNKLFANVVRGQESNFLDVPTDCPQRDERMGWTGDTQVFANAATYNRFAPEFYTKWLCDLNLSRIDEIYPIVAPYMVRKKNSGGADGGAAGWSDAGIIVPYQLFRKYGDTRILKRYLDNMERFLEREVEVNGGNLILPEAVFGDWLNIDAPTDKSLISTAYLAGMTHLLARIARICGDPERATRLDRRFAAVRSAFQQTFFTAEGDLTGRTQTAALLAFTFDLIPEPFRKKTEEFLVHDIRETRHGHLSTGFLGTPLILPVLTRLGHADLAYQLLEETTYPGWLFPVTNGATTMWERWNSWTPEQGFGDVNMNSFNHYAYGAVAEWFYESICGIRPGENGGFRHFRLAPVPGGTLTGAEAEYNSLYGRIASAWEIRKDTLVWRFTVPFGTRAELVMPAGYTGSLPPEVPAGTYEYTLKRSGE